MPGQPRTRGDTPRPRQVPRWQQRAAAAVTPAEQLAVAGDRLRRGLARLRRPQRDPRARLEAAAEADRLAREAAMYLNRLAEQAERVVNGA